MESLSQAVLRITSDQILEYPPGNGLFLENLRNLEK
jgi:hypothetical protein